MHYFMQLGELLEGAMDSGIKLTRETVLECHAKVVDCLKPKAKPQPPVETRLEIAVIQTPTPAPRHEQGGPDLPLGTFPGGVADLVANSPTPELAEPPYDRPQRNQGAPDGPPPSATQPTHRPRSKRERRAATKRARFHPHAETEETQPRTARPERVQVVSLKDLKFVGVELHAVSTTEA